MPERSHPQQNTLCRVPWQCIYTPGWRKQQVICNRTVMFSHHRMRCYVEYTVSYPYSRYLRKHNPLIHLICQVTQFNFTLAEASAALCTPRSQVTELLFLQQLLKNLQSKTVRGKALCQKEWYTCMHLSIMCIISFDSYCFLPLHLVPVRSGPSQYEYFLWA